MYIVGSKFVNPFPPVGLGNFKFRDIIKNATMNILVHNFFLEFKSFADVELLGWRAQRFLTLNVYYQIAFLKGCSNTRSSEIWLCLLDLNFTDAIFFVSLIFDNLICKNASHWKDQNLSWKCCMCWKFLFCIICIIDLPAT